MKELRVTTLERYELPEDLLRGAAIELPLGERTNAYRLEVKGWVAGNRSEATHVELLDGRRVRPLLRMRADDGRDFHGSVGALELGRHFELEVRTVLADGGHSLLGRIEGERTRISSSYTPRLQPLIVTQLGRSGSSWLAWLLSHHPGVVAYYPFAHDARIATYWISVLQSLADPASGRSQISATDFEAHRWWLGDGPLATWKVADQRVAAWLDAEAVEELATMSQERVDAFYDRAVPREEKPAARYFVEKADAASIASDLALELYVESREIILVRDFRDLLASILAFDEKRRVQWFGRDADPDADHLKVFAKSARVLVDRWRRRSSEAHLVRYEDLVLEPVTTLTAIFEYLDLDASRTTVESVLEAGSREAPGMREHRTTSDAAASIGRWRSDLPRDFAEQANHLLADVLREFGYSAER